MGYTKVVLMKLIIESESSIGNRQQNLDRVFQFDTGKTSGCVLIDGFLPTNESFHYVDFLVCHFQKMLLDGMDIDNVEKIFYEYKDTETELIGKAAIAIVLHSKDEVRSLNIGDVRIYFLSEKKRSIDDSLAQRLIDYNISPKESLNTHPLRNKLTKYISKDSTHEVPNFTSKKVKDGDIIIMCTDGFWSKCLDDEIFKISSIDDLIKLFRGVVNNEDKDKDKDNASIAFLNFKCL